MKTRLDQRLATVITVLGLLIPLLIAMGRILIPDIAYDTINYHTFTGQRGWHWLNFSQIEFYPNGLWSYFPLLDMINSIGQKIFGYRLGTLTEVFFFYISIILIFIITRRIGLNVGNKLLDAFLKINIFISLEALFQLATYLTDIINAFFFLVFLLAFIGYLEKRDRRLLLFSTSIISIVVVSKYSNYFYFIPYGMYLLFDIAKTTPNISRKLQEITLHTTIFFLINGPWILWNYCNTHNPVFPYYNSIFQSEYFNTNSFVFDQGPTSIVQSLLYPFYVLLGKAKINQYFPIIPDYKFSITILTLAACFPLFKKHRLENRIEWLLYLYFSTAYTIWVFIFGYARYAIGLEFLAGMLIIASTRLLLNETLKYKKLLIVVICGLLLWQDISFIENNFRFDISWRPTLWTSKDLYVNELRNINNNSYYYPELDGVDIYLKCGRPDLGYIVPSNLISLPVLNISTDTNRQTEYIFEALNRIIRSNDSEIINFVTVIKEEGMDSYSEQCYSLLDSLDANISESIEIPFLGYEHVKFKVLKGTVALESILK